MFQEFEGKLRDEQEKSAEKTVEIQQLNEVNFEIFFDVRSRKCINNGIIKCPQCFWDINDPAYENIRQRYQLHLEGKYNLDVVFHISTN